jgi:hypothetical protein
MALVTGLSGRIDKSLAQDLVDDFLLIRQDAATETLGRGNAGKFIESVVQVLQFLDTGKFDKKPTVDAILLKIESSALDEGLRIISARFARGVYAMRNKRNIAHKASIDPSLYDLRYIFASAQWLMAELLRQCSGKSMDETGALIGAVQAPIGGLVEDFSGARVVVKNVISTRDEMLILLHSHYPQRATLADLTASMSRRKSLTVRNTAYTLWTKKFVHGDPRGGYVLTAPTGTDEAIRIVKAHMA